MTREEAIKELTELLPEEFLSEYAEAIKMGIEALKQQPTDAVDRMTIKEYLKSFGTAYELGKEKGLDIALNILDKYMAEWNGQIIRDLPSVTPQPKMGRWIEENPPMVERYPFCSECGFVNPFENALNYCPNCGSKMSEIPTGQIVANGELYPGEFDDPLTEEGSEE